MRTKCEVQTEMRPPPTPTIHPGCYELQRMPKESARSHKKCSERSVGFPKPTYLIGTVCSHPPGQSAAVDFFVRTSHTLRGGA
jgi:hypothetical protein